jgi:Na+-translocating ferredoxin:NAD+ oxidoreductase subunit G
VIHPDGFASGLPFASILALTIFITATSQASITFSVGIQNDGTVNGYSITNIAETPGLGMKAQEEAFYSQFEGKNVDSFTVVKAAPSSDSEIESISGATITFQASERRSGFL